MIRLKLDKVVLKLRKTFNRYNSEDSVSRSMDERPLEAPNFAL